MAKSHVLEFEAYPEAVLLQGFDEEILRGLGMFMASPLVGEDRTAPYRILTGRGRWRPAATTKQRRRRPWRRHVRRDGEDLVVMPGGRVRLAPGRAKAVVEWADAGAAVDGLVATTLLEAALIHALAMGGCVVNHAAALAVEGVELLAVGPSRAGKSTLSAAVLAAGGAVVSDDSVILGFDDEGVPSAGALRRNLWLRDGSVELLPEALRARLWETASFGERRWGLERAAFPELVPNQGAATGDRAVAPRPQGSGVRRAAGQLRRRARRAHPGLVPALSLGSVPGGEGEVYAGAAGAGQRRAVLSRCGWVGLWSMIR